MSNTQKIHILWADDEIDLLKINAGVFECFEIKSGATFTPDWFRQLGRFEKLNPGQVRSTVVYGGTESSARTQGEVWAWTHALEKL